MSVYFIYEVPEVRVDPDIQHIVDQNHIQFVTQFKIGESQDPAQRIKNLQTGNPRQLQVYRILKCNNKKEAQNVETAIHTMFNSRRKLGEWFNVTKDEVDYIYVMALSILNRIHPNLNTPLQPAISV